MNVRLMVPTERELPLSELMELLGDGTSLEPFSPEIIALCSEISDNLSSDPEAQNFPELQTLAFFVRKSALHQLKEQFEQLKARDRAICPRGLVFHLAPSNVDTIFVYSWLLSALVGNRNVLRVSSRSARQTAVLCRILSACLVSKPPELRSSTIVISYGHEDEITAALSQAADMRVIWGGDHSVSRIRKFALLPHAKELTFPNRFSLAALKSSSFLTLDEKTRINLSRDFYNDTYWFDQLGCSSPRLVAWCGSQSDAKKAGEIFWKDLQDQIDKQRYTLPTGSVLSKLASVYQFSLSNPVTSIERFSNELYLINVESISDLPRIHPGLGSFHQYTAEKLADLVPFIKRPDQTLVHFGFDHDELSSFAHQLNGRGIDRIVPIGQALAFNRFWDGYDLLQEFTRTTYIGPIRNT